MKTRGTWWLAVLVMSTVLEAAAQDARQMDATLTRTTSSIVESRTQPGRTVAETTLALERSSLDSGKLRALPFSRITRQRTPFVTETRLPIVEMWDGRIQLACVHQRHSYRALHPAYLHSSRHHMAALYHTGALLPRARTNYGVTLSLHFGRSAQSAPASQGR